jgi:hypothetical protein
MPLFQDIKGHRVVKDTLSDEVDHISTKQVFSFQPGYSFVSGVDSDRVRFTVSNIEAIERGFKDSFEFSV